jgi:MFS transporter, OFA family, oxalate/formate antiporter
MRCRRDTGTGKMRGLPHSPYLEPDAALTRPAPITLPAHWPFDVRRVPFFYGWVIWVVSTVGFLMSVPGQTMGMAVFTDHFMAAFGLTRTELSTAYFFGTLGSSLFLTRAGRWYDRHQARTMLVAASVVLGGVLLFISSVDYLTAAMPAAWQGWAGFTLILLGYFGVRFSGQGVLTSAARNLLLVWFERRRGLVSGARGVFVSLGFSLAPLLLAMLIDGWGWRGALWVLAGVVGGVFAVAALLTVRDTPESCGLLPDGMSAEAHAAMAQRRVRSFTVEEARRSAVFWIYAAALSIHSLFGTAVTFHIVDVFQQAGRTATEAFRYFLPMAIVATTVNLASSWLADQTALKPFLLVMLGAFVAGAWGLLHLHADWGYWLLVAGFGAGGGLWGLLSNLAYVRNFGRLHLGAISGLSLSLTVFASAVGPLLFSVGLDWMASYDGAIWLCLVLNLGLLVAAIFIRHHEPQVSMP